MQTFLSSLRGAVIVLSVVCALSGCAMGSDVDRAGLCEGVAVPKPDFVDPEPTVVLRSLLGRSEKELAALFEAGGVPSVLPTGVGAARPLLSATEDECGLRNGVPSALASERAFVTASDDEGESAPVLVAWHTDAPFHSAVRSREVTTEIAQALAPYEGSSLEDGFASDGRPAIVVRFEDAAVPVTIREELREIDVGGARGVYLARVSVEPLDGGSASAWMYLGIDFSEL